MRCNRVRRIIRAYVSNEVSHRESNLIKEHLSKCQDCAKDERVIKRIVAVLEQQPDVVVEEVDKERLKNRVLNRLQELENTGQANRGYLSWRPNWLFTLRSRTFMSKKNISIGIAFAVVLIIICCSLFMKGGPGSVLAQMQEQIDKAISMHGRMVGVGPKGEEVQTDIWFLASGKLRMDSSENTVWINGDKCWEYQKGFQKVLIRQSQQSLVDSMQQAATGGLLDTFPIKTYDVVYHGDEEIAEGVASKYEIRHSKAENLRCMLWLNPDTQLPYRMETHVFEKNDWRLSSSINFEWNLSLPMEIFEPKFPPTVTVQDMTAGTGWQSNALALIEREGMSVGITDVWRHPQGFVVVGIVAEGVKIDVGDWPGGERFGKTELEMQILAKCGFGLVDDIGTEYSLSRFYPSYRTSVVGKKWVTFYSRVPGLPNPGYFKFTLLGKSVDRTRESEERDWEFFELQVAAPITVSFVPPAGFPEAALLINDWSVLQRQDSICNYYFREQNYEDALSAIEMVPVESVHAGGKGVYWLWKTLCLEKLERFEEAEEACKKYIGFVEITNRYSPESQVVIDAKAILKRIRDRIRERTQ